MESPQLKSLKRQPERARKGFSLLTAALMGVAAIGMVGLAVDLGLMYVAKSETQAFTDSAALAATLELDGTQEGLDRAVEQVVSDPNRWMFGTQEFNNIEIQFAKDLEGPWEPYPSDPDGYTNVRVQASVPVPVFFVPLLRGGSYGFNVSGMGFLQLPLMRVYVNGDSGSGQQWRSGLREGMFPFSPLAHNKVGPHYGLVVGERHTLRWGANPRVDMNVCAGDNYQYMVDLAKSDVEVSSTGTSKRPAPR